MKHKFIHDAEHHLYRYIIKARDKVFLGVAECHEPDWDFENERTGKEIAYIRASIQEQQDQLRLLKAQEQALAHINMIYARNSDKYDLNSKEVALVRKQYCVIQNRITELKNLIAAEKESLTFMIQSKDLMYRKVRALRGRNKYSSTTKENRTDS